MLYEQLTQAIRKRLYLLSSERFKSETSPLMLERYAAKHPLLRPEIIVVNDQPFGFKSTNKEDRNLELYPIFFEIEYTEDEDTSKYVEHFDLYCETPFRNRERLSALVQLCQLYDKLIMVERVRRIGQDPSDQTLVIYSKLPDVILDTLLENDTEESEMSSEQLEQLIDHHIYHFVQFIKALDDVLSKGKLSSGFIDQSPGTAFSG